MARGTDDGLSQVSMNGQQSIKWGYSYGHSEINPLLFIPRRQYCGLSMLPDF